ncbi:unnamed protein product [Paramecium sonneborni]|uniref:Uncharacterized protein n=1 Tax=Paramecium sonneborni TaxID=65129 RepID=A0A8S1RDH8_9CILI|nr:unnamed protein product [Paramecium sonneborni]
MSDNTLKNWMEQLNDLLEVLCQKVQDCFDESVYCQHKAQESIIKDWNKYLPQNQLSFDNQDVFLMKHTNEKFTLRQFVFQRRYEEQIYEVKLFDSISEAEIPQGQYQNQIFEFFMIENNALLLIKQSNKANTNRSEQQPTMIIKEVYTGFIQENQLWLSLIKNIGLCQQAAFHPLNPNYLVILQTSQDQNRQHTFQKYNCHKEQYLMVYSIKNPRQPIVRINLNQAMNGNALAFSFSQVEDQNQFLIYFINNQGIIYYYELILHDMVFKLQTKMYLQTSKQELIQFVKERPDKDFKINYDITSQDDYQKGCIKFKSFQNSNYQFPKSTYILFQKMSIIDYHLFFIISKQLNENLFVQVLIGKDLQILFEIFQDEVQFQKQIDNNDYIISNLNKNQQPKIIYQSDNVTHIVQNQLDFPNRNQLLILYHNSLISIDYSNVIQFKQDQSPINVTCIDLIPFANKYQDQSNSEPLILQVLCLDLYKSKQLLLRITNRTQKQTFKLLPQKLLLSLTEQNLEANKFALDFYNEQNTYLMNKKALQKFKKYLEYINQQKLPHCKTEEEIITINEELANNFHQSIKGVAIKIKLETENMQNDIEIKMKGNLTQQEIRNIQLQSRISEKNEKIHSLLDQLQSISASVIRQQLINSQKQQDLDQFKIQYDNIQEQIKQNKQQLEEQIQLSNRTKQDIEVIQSNLIQKIQQKKE